MADGADYPGYPEPESRFDKGELKEFLGQQGAMFYDSFLESLKTGVAAVVGGLIGANMDIIEISGGDIVLLFTLFVIAHMTQHFVRAYISEIGVLPDG